MAVKRNYRINLRNYGNPPAIMVSQYDENYDLVFEVYDGVVPATGLNVYTVKLVGRQPGDDPALKYEFTGTVSGIANNILSFTIDTTMTGRAGKGTAEIVILDTTNDVKFASFNLPVYVEKAAVPDDAIDADVERAQEIADEVQDIVDTAASEVKGEAEAWAVGQRDGVDVPSTDPTYENNAKYYAEQAADAAASIGIDDTLTQSGKAADAKKTGDELAQLKNTLSAIGDGKYPIGDPIVFENAIYDTTNKVVKPLTDAVVWCYPLIGRISYKINVTNRTNVLFGVSNTLYNGVEMSVSYSVNADATEYVFDNVQNYAYLYITKKGQSSEYGIDVSYPFWNLSLTQSQMSTINETTKHLTIKANSKITPYIDGYLVAATGNIVTNSNFRTTDFIDIAPAKNIIVMMPRLNSSFTGAGLAFYGANKNYISGITCNVSTETTAEERIIEVPQNAQYIRTTVRVSEWDEFYAKQDDIYVNTLEIKKIKDKASTFGVQMFAKIGVIGDSISCGWAKDKNGNNSRRNTGISWPQQMARRLGCTAYNLGASGVDPVEWFQSDYEFAQYCYTQYQSVGFCDLYIIGLGLNPTSSLGSTSDINQSDYTQNGATFYGQYARIIQMINAEHPDAIVICVTEPTTRIASTDQAVRDICALSFINANLVDLEKDYFDLFNTEEIISERQPDGLHYTPYGYSLLSDAMETALNDYIAKNSAKFKYVGVASV